MKQFNDICGKVINTANFLANHNLCGILQNENNINQALALLSDDASRDTYLKEFVQWALNGFLKRDVSLNYYGGINLNDFNKYLQLVNEKEIHKDIEYPVADKWVEAYTKATTFIMEQYRYDDKVKIEKGDICLDIGACVGDTAIWMAENGATKVYAFEIDRNNLSYLEKNIKNTKNENIIKIIDKGCASVNSAFFYAPANNNMGGGRIFQIAPENVAAYKVDCVTIDHFCEQFKIAPSFIKMDIEGGEIDALKGGGKTFAAYRPKFAVCIYHNWSDRWEIPKIINNMIEGYEFYVKKSAPNAETVLMGCPKK